MNTMSRPYSAADLPITESGRVYHLNISPGDLAPAVILVGDPDRVPLIAGAHLDEIEVDVFHRGLRTMTGRARGSGLRVTVTTSGMGTPSLEIVLQELAILNEIDLARRERKKYFAPLRLIRVGTSGALASSTTLGTLIITDYAVGLDNTGLFYEVPHSCEGARLLEERSSALLETCRSSERFSTAVKPYVSRAHPAVLNALVTAAREIGAPWKIGVTVSNSGFFANQGRDIARVRPVYPEIDRVFGNAATGIPNLSFENMEMESSFLLHYAAGMGYSAGVICPVVAHRPSETFAEDYRRAVANASEAAIGALEILGRADRS